MKLLLACVNSTHSLVGYDWNEGRIFWSVPSSSLRVCSACYDGNSLWISSDNLVMRLNGEGNFQMELRGRFDALAHSVHLIGEDLVGVADTGNSQLVLLSKDGKLGNIFRPLETWGNYPSDAIHLNDFAVTPVGLLASCFGYRPWREIVGATSWEHWSTGGYGLILNLTGADGKGIGRIVGCGFDQPHSLHYVDPHRLYLCSSATGILHACELDPEGLLRERRRYKITDNHFLRGAHRAEDGWFLGGSSFRHGKRLADDVEIYRLDEASGNISTRRLDSPGEIYDILPWRDEIMGPMIQRNFPQHASINL